MECTVCTEDTQLICIHCDTSCCSRCLLNCDVCSNKTCPDCIDDCDCCGKLMCRTCAFEVNVCKCCKREVNASDAGMLCGDCIIEDWFSKSTSIGFICVSCESVCNHGACKVLGILNEQTSCPICWESFSTTRPFQLQACELHKVCTTCNYDERRGCPLCRVGKWND